jgi:hypothetical protein
VLDSVDSDEPRRRTARVGFRSFTERRRDGLGDDDEEDGEEANLRGGMSEELSESEEESPLAETRPEESARLMPAEAEVEEESESTGTTTGALFFGLDAAVELRGEVAVDFFFDVFLEAFLPVVEPSVVAPEGDLVIFFFLPLDFLEDVFLPFFFPLDFLGFFSETA